MKLLTSKRHMIVRSMMHTHNLDIGCGDTPITNESIGADLLYNGINCTSLPFDDSEFDSVTALELFEHLTWQEQFQALSEIYRVLSNGGQFIITIPNSSSFMIIPQKLTWAIRERTTHTEYYHTQIKGHISLISPNEMLNMLHWFKFTIVEHRRILLYDYIIRAKKRDI